jgi:hypothetical protein
VTSEADNCHDHLTVTCRHAATAAHLANAGTVTMASRATKQLIEAARRHVVAEMQAQMRALKEEEVGHRVHGRRLDYGIEARVIAWRLSHCGAIVSLCSGI